ncbi:FCD domain-containing protein, partial [Kibdelosporangium lantanae]
MINAFPVEATSLDDSWHEQLLTHCPNKRLLQLIKNQKRVVHRYESAYFYEKGRIVESAAQHHRIAEALQAGDIDRAAAELRDNWEVGMRLLIALIES